MSDSLVQRLRGGARLSAGVTQAPSADRARVAAVLREHAVDVVHVDHADGSFGVAPLPPEAGPEFAGFVSDVHVLSADPAPLLDAVLSAPPALVTVHAEAVGAARALRRIAEAGALAGVALCPQTPLENAAALIECAELVLVLTLDPRDPAAAADHDVALARLAALRGTGPLLAVDGRVTADRVRAYARAGANLIVAGGGLLTGDLAANVAAFSQELDPIPHTTAPSGARREHVSR